MDEMNGIIKVDLTADRLLVSARELHEFLGVNTKYQDWFPRMCEYGFTEGADFNFLKIEKVQQEGTRAVTRRIDDAALTIDMAKEICMVTRNEKGRQARQYFIQLEKDWNSPEKVMARALKIADARINALTAQIEADAPKVRYADAVAEAEGGMLLREFAKILRQNGVEIGEKRLFSDLRQRGLLIKCGRDQNKPTQYAMERDWFTVKEVVIDVPLGFKITKTTPLVTGKGRQYLLNMYLSEKAEQDAGNGETVCESVSAT